MGVKVKVTKVDDSKSKYFHFYCIKMLRKKLASHFKYASYERYSWLYINTFSSFAFNCEQFSFEDCNFNIQRSKENTARVVVWLMGVENSYTMEASFCGSTLGSRANTHLTIKDFEGIGQTFCETLLDYYNESPQNVRYYYYYYYYILLIKSFFL